MKRRSFLAAIPFLAAITKMVGETKKTWLPKLKDGYDPTKPLMFQVLAKSEPTVTALHDIRAGETGKFALGEARCAKVRFIGGPLHNQTRFMDFPLADTFRVPEMLPLKSVGFYRGISSTMPVDSLIFHNYKKEIYYTAKDFSSFKSPRIIYRHVKNK